MTTTIDRLRDVSSFCRQGAALPPELAGWLSAGIERFLGREARDLDGALGLIQAQGGIPWWREDAIRRRDAGATWRIDREHTAMPPHYAGTAQEQLWRAFKSGAAMPLGERQLRTILGDWTHVLVHSQ